MDLQEFRQSFAGVMIPQGYEVSFRRDRSVTLYRLDRDGRHAVFDAYSRQEYDRRLQELLAMCDTCGERLGPGHICRYDRRTGLGICPDCGEYIIDGYCGCPG